MAAIISCAIASDGHWLIRVVAGEAGEDDWANIVLLLMELPNIHSLPRATHFEQGYCRSHFIFDSVQEMHDFLRVRFVLDNHELSSIIIYLCPLNERMEERKCSRLIATLFMSCQEIAASELCAACLPDVDLMLMF